MKQYSFLNISLFILLLISLAMLTNCTTHTSNIVDCEGYTGPVKNENAQSLLKICHFMPKDTIAVWSARYQRNKSNINSSTLPNTNGILGDSCSFNNSIVRAIITNDSCIGLRVVYGMDEKNKVHIILVGIKPDYSTLYIRKPKDCAETSTSDKGALQKSDGDDDPTGGGEMAQDP
jgi:hypothetical protein